MRVEKNKAPKKVHVTFSIPIEVNALLHSLVEKRGLSNFATKALQRALKDEQSALKKAYLAANKDPDRKKAITDWAGLDTEAWDD
ncbi:MAG: hypothetical protein V4487_06490 [Chlamydiota bacterium]